MARAGKYQTQPDLFIADASFVHTKELLPFMTTSWFSLSKSPRHTPIVHEHPNYKISVTSSSDRGIATVWDHDLLIFLFSQLIHSHNRGEQTSARIRFTGYELFQFLHRSWVKAPAGKRNYEMLWAAIERLHHTHIRTNIKNHGDIESGDIQFYWLPHIEKMKFRGKSVGYEVWLDPKIYEWTQNLKNVLSLDPSYFDLKSGLDRFLYLWSRKSVGSKQGAIWEETFDLLHEKSGSTLAAPQFKQMLRKSIKNNSLPSYTINELPTKKGSVLQVQRDIFHTPL